ncbi:hypothetical protein WN51_05457 [Melipona quadrifasciata]|uniref:Uncharacterized protein n=1 Tax=Melipona quadrifasciata TaxID=166423 RepID=A0A0N0U7S8_9HYME|nr:hypothetical protein WN51_05457 [Melipona quadrifasciata]
MAMFIKFEEIIVGTLNAKRRHLRRNGTGGERSRNAGARNLKTRSIARPVRCAARVSMGVAAIPRGGNQETFGKSKSLAGNDLIEREFCFQPYLASEYEEKSGSDCLITSITLQIEEKNALIRQMRSCVTSYTKYEYRKKIEGNFVAIVLINARFPAFWMIGISEQVLQDASFVTSLLLEGERRKLAVLQRELQVALEEGGSVKVKEKQRQELLHAISKIQGQHEQLDKEYRIHAAGVLLCNSRGSGKVSVLSLFFSPRGP